MRAQLAMFDFNWGELILIGVVALVAIGPKELPGALRTLGQWVAKARRMANEFQNQFRQAMREAEVAEVKKEVDEMALKAQSYAHFNAIDDIRKDLENAASPPHELVKPLSTTDLVEPLPTTPETVGSHSPSPVDTPAGSREGVTAQGKQSAKAEAKEALRDLRSDTAG
jgi:sec-independent protein translocase protein TatB